VIFSHNLNWFFGKDPDWTQTNILPILGQTNPEDRNAVWSGFLWGAQIPVPTLYRQMKLYLLQVAKEQTLGKRGYVGNLAGIILCGWRNINEEVPEHYISNAEMRDVLLAAGDEFRSSVLWNLKKWEDENDKWSDLLEEFLRDVWPRQISVRTPNISTRLLDLAIEAPERFLDRLELILPLLTTIDFGYFWISNLLDAQETIVDVYPEKVLTLLQAVLPENVVAWPFNTEEVLSRIGGVDPSLRTDERLLELNRKWNAR